jgi:hypothetical protein
MTIQKITSFQTSDGKMWDNKDEAKAHENHLNASAELRRLLDTAMRSGRPEAVISELLDFAPIATAILRNFLKRQPKADVKPEVVLAKAA